MRAYDGKNFSGTPFIPWARISLTTTGGLPFSLNDSDVEFGLFQVSLYYPPENRHRRRRGDGRRGQGGLQRPGAADPGGRARLDPERAPRSRCCRKPIASACR
jgi:hypothetical protein